MSNDVPANRFFVVGGKHRTPVNLGHDLVCDDYGHTEFVGKALQVP
jgi:hypothetical protein